MGLEIQAAVEQRYGSTGEPLTHAEAATLMGKPMGQQHDPRVRFRRLEDRNGRRIAFFGALVPRLGVSREEH